MGRKDFRRWARRQYRDPIQPWPRWIRWSIGIAVLLLIIGKLVGVL